MKFYLVVLMYLSSLLLSCMKVQPKGLSGKSENVIQYISDPNSLDKSSFTINEDVVLTKNGFVSLQTFMATAELKIQNINESPLIINISSLTLHSKANIFTFGQNIKLNIQNLDSDHGQISTFPEFQFADIGKRGRSGGELTMNINSGKGDLKINMRGEIGGIGYPGKAPSALLDGVDAKFPTRAFDGNYRDCPCKRIECSQNNTAQEYLTHPPENGKAGAPGTSGYRGGDSGRLKYSISENLGMTVHILKIPGAGGAGGKGGLGGKGGKDIMTNFKRICEIPLKNAEPGSNGTDGINGESGDEEIVCEYRDNVKINCF